MPIINNGTKNSLLASDLPSGYTRPTVTTFADWQYKRTVTLSVLKATVENATASTTMVNILANATIGITKQVLDIVTAAFTAVPTATVYADLTNLTNNISPIVGTGDYLKNTAVSYQCTVDIYIKSI